MRRSRILGLLAALVLWLKPAAGAAQAQSHETTMKKLTPVMFVQAIEPCIPFWTETLGFEKTMEVPSEDGTRLGFAAFQKGPVEVMYQTLESLAQDIPPLVEEAEAGTTFLFIEVSSVEELDRLDEALTAADAPRVMPRRKTFYGADEVAVRDPCGTVVTLAAFEAQGGEGS